MPFISITRLRLRSIRFLPGFALHTNRSLRQVKAASGFQRGSVLADRRWTFWTMTAWDSQDSMRGFMTAGDHRVAMQHLVNWCDEASVVHWVEPTDALPSWADADAQMRETGRASKVRFPSPEHSGLSYHTPRVTTAVPIRPAKPKISTA